MAFKSVSHTKGMDVSSRKIIVGENDLVARKVVAAISQSVEAGFATMVENPESDDEEKVYVANNDIILVTLPGEMDTPIIVVDSAWICKCVDLPAWTKGTPYIIGLHVSKSSPTCMEISNFFECAANIISTCISCGDFETWVSESFRISRNGVPV